MLLSFSGIIFTFYCWSYIFIAFFVNPYQRIYLPILEREEAREREGSRAGRWGGKREREKREERNINVREKYQLFASCTPGPGIKPAPFWDNTPTTEPPSQGYLYLFL